MILQSRVVLTWETSVHILAYLRVPCKVRIHTQLIRENLECDYQVGLSLSSSPLQPLFNKQMTKVSYQIGGTCHEVRRTSRDESRFRKNLERAEGEYALSAFELLDL